MSPAPSFRTSRPSRSPRRCPLRVEQLEDRCLLAASLAPYGQLPLSFEANQGQTAPQVNFLARGPGYGLFLTPTEAVLSLLHPAAPGAAPGQAPAGDVLRLQLVGANPAPAVQGLDPQAGTSNYLLGNDPSQWHTDIANYGQVAYQDVYPGVNLVYYGSQRQLEYDFDVAPGADPGSIRLAFQGASGMELDGQGNLVLHTTGGDVVEHAPVVYQENGGGRQAVSGRYVLYGGGQVGFAVGAYDSAQPLVIDPVLSYSTYLGGSNGDRGEAIAVDTAGAAYVIGITNSTDFPTASPLQSSRGGGPSDAFVAKLNASGTALVYSTYLGGSDYDEGYGIALDSAGDAYVTGLTYSRDFPTVNPQQGTSGGFADAFVAKLNAGGTALAYSTYLGGGDNDLGSGIAVDSAGDAYVVGNTRSTDFPTANALQGTYGGGIEDAFVTKLNAGGTALAYSTYLGGSGIDQGYGIAVDTAGNAFVTGASASTDFRTVNALQPARSGGYDAFVAKLNAGGTALAYSTYLGGGQDEAGNGIAVDTAGNAYVTGYTTSADFPTANPLQGTYGGLRDAFVAKLNAAGTALAYSTYLGGSSTDEGDGIAVDGAGSAYVTGVTDSANFPTVDPLQGSSGGSEDAFVAEFNASGTALVYSTYLGGGGYDQGFGIAVDSAGGAYITGVSSSTTTLAPVALQRNNAGGDDAFITKIAGAAPPVTPGEADLSVTLVSPLRVAEGQPVAFQFAVHNAGPGDAAATLTDALPAAALSVTASLNQGTFAVSGGVLTAALGTLPAGATVTGTITLAADEGFLSDAVQVSSSTPDPNPGNNVAGTHTLVTDPPLLAQGGFTITAGPGAPAQVLATFTDPTPGEPASAYGAVIAWGDGSTADVVVSPGQAAGAFTVQGAHAYAAPGTYTVTVSLFQDGVPDAVVTSTAMQSASPSDPAPVGASSVAVAQTGAVPPVQLPAVAAGPERRLRHRRRGEAVPVARGPHRRRHAGGPAGPGQGAGVGLAESPAGPGGVA